MSARRNVRRPRRPPPRQGLPRWAWLVMGAAALLALLALGSIWYRHRAAANADHAVQPSAQPTPSTATGHPDKPAAKPKAADQSKSQSQANEPQYDFYKLLPKFKMNVPTQPKETPAKPQAKARETVPSVPPEPPGREAPAPKAGSYVVQTGSFRQYEQAERMKASLALLGLESSIHKVVMGEDQIYYRVRIGPLRDAKELAVTQAKLREQGYAGIVMRNPD